jgi:hypothetical protein
MAGFLGKTLSRTGRMMALTYVERTVSPDEYVESVQRVLEIASGDFGDS